MCDKRNQVGNIECHLKQNVLQTILSNAKM